VRRDGLGGKLGPAVLGLSLGFRLASARADLPASGELIRTHDYAIDLAQTPVLSSTRVTGLAGAFVGMGEGLDGAAQNPAAPAYRFPWSRGHFDYELGFSFMSSASVSNTDFFNSGKHVRGDEEFLFLDLALALQFGRWGFAFSTGLQQYTLGRGTDTDSAERLVAQFALSHALAAYAFADGQLLIGAGQRSSVLSVGNENDIDNDEQVLFQALGAGYEAGLLIRPNEQPYRIGAAIRSAVDAKPSTKSKVAVLYEDDPDNALYLPNRVVVPWNVSVGFAMQLGPRPLNPRFLDPNRVTEELDRYLQYRARERARKRAIAERRALAAKRDPSGELRALDAELATESALDALHRVRTEKELDRELEQRYLSLARFHVLISASLEVLGPVDDAVGVASFIDRRVQRSGRHASYSPRLGVETEPIAHWLRVRAGSYLEPTRFDDNPHGSRLHGTFGFDQRVLAWDVFGLFPEGSIFRAAGSLDLARDYFGWGVALGLWH
jgi:hypothetical protein